MWDKVRSLRSLRRMDEGDEDDVMMEREIRLGSWSVLLWGWAVQRPLAA